MTANRNYSSVARLAALTSAVSNSATTLPVDLATGFPTAPFTMVIDAGRAAEEVVTITSVVGLNLTAVRGEDGTAAQPHDAGASVRHMASARDFREAAEHIALSGGVHGVAGNLVGTADTQILDNKTFQAAVTDHIPLVVKAAVSQTANLVSIQDSAGAALASISVSGRLAMGGTDATGSSTYAASAAGLVPLIAKGAVSQTAHLQDWRDSSATVLAFVSATGALTASAITTAGAISSGAITAAAITAAAVSATGVTTTAVSAVASALIVNCFAAQSASALQIKSSAAVDSAGVAGETGTFQLYHGGSTTNKVPFRVHGGSVPVTILSGNTSQGATIDISSYGFTVAPLMTLTVRQENESSIQRRVAVTIEGLPTTSSVGIRVHQTAGDTLSSDTGYRVHWIAWQFLPSASAG